MRVCIVLHADLFEPWPIVRPMHEVEILRRLGREVSVFSWIKDPASPLPLQEVRDGVRVHRIKIVPPKNPLTRVLRFPLLSRRFAHEIKELRPDAIVCHDLEMLWASVIAGRSLSAPVLYHAHEDWPAMVSERSKSEAAVFEWLERRLVKRAAHVYVAGEERAERFRRWGRPVTVVYGSKSLAEIPHVMKAEREARRAEYGFGRDEFVVGIAGSLGRDESLPTVFDALGRMPENVKLFVVGGGDEKVAEAKQLARERGIATRVAFTGRLPTDAYLRYTATIDVGLGLYYPTTRNQITVVPLKLFDYMGLGIPVVVSDFPELNRIVVGTCGCGLAVTPMDPVALRRALEGLIDRPEERRGMGIRARQCFVERYCWDRQEDVIVRSHRIFAAE